MTANRTKGDVSVAIGDRVFIMKLATNALCIAEEIAKKPAIELMMEVRGGDRFRFGSTRALFFAGLQEHHGDEFRTEESVAPLIDELGLEATRTVLADCLAASYPPPKAADGGDGQTVPPPAADR